MSRSLAVPLRASVLPQRVGAMEVLLAFCVMLVLAWALQHRIGAYGAEFSDDDGSHFVTGLLVRDYLARMHPSSPLAFLKEFAAHYPLIGIGHWPPLFYGLEAVWMLLAGTSRSAMLLLSAFITAASATTLYHAAASRLGRAETPWLGRAAGAAVACVFMLCPVVQAQTGMLMLDVLTALLCLLAMLAFAQFMDTARIRDAVLFGLVAGAALMTKGNAACLALLPPLAILIGRRFDLLLRPSLWLSAVVVLVVAGPWYWFTYSLVAVGFQYGFDQNYFVAAGIAESGLPAGHAWAPGRAAGGWRHDRHHHATAAWPGCGLAGLLRGADPGSAGLPGTGPVRNPGSLHASRLPAGPAACRLVPAASCQAPAAVRRHCARPGRPLPSRPFRAPWRGGGNTASAARDGRGRFPDLAPLVSGEPVRPAGDAG
ncbi:glycosyltransferase family 39 protein [Siccirubricoccus sp. G192]|uniref:ArnT family glycosyltransferase n=1 Tax=Siccirubricoccus sp. G192 TaxID=2849651 RepID=UPI001C2BA86F|nr:glycosyltransferase family 39 protein [Siccirubricoccus sp. G192]MBV1799999.1 glycosyltransferase family 39 protein [Siccirubricoccus sp. G192]